MSHDICVQSIVAYGKLLLEPQLASQVRKLNEYKGMIQAGLCVVTNAPTSTSKPHKNHISYI